MEHLTTAKSFYADQLQNSYGRPLGATPHEVEQLESLIGAALPAAYREYLLWMGKHRQGPFRGSEWFLEDLERNRENLPDLLKENEQDVPAEDVVVFFTHQGYMAAWFVPPAVDDDPPCFYFTEVDPESIRKPVPFSEFLMTELRGAAAATR